MAIHDRRIAGPKRANRSTCPRAVAKTKTRSSTTPSRSVRPLVSKPTRTTVRSNAHCTRDRTPELARASMPLRPTTATISWGAWARQSAASRLRTKQPFVCRSWRQRRVTSTLPPSRRVSARRCPSSVYSRVSQLIRRLTSIRLMLNVVLFAKLATVKRLQERADTLGFEHTAFAATTARRWARLSAAKAPAATTNSLSQRTTQNPVAISPRVLCLRNLPADVAGIVSAPPPVAKTPVTSRWSADKPCCWPRKRLFTTDITMPYRETSLRLRSPRWLKTAIVTREILVWLACNGTPTTRFVGLPIVPVLRASFHQCAATRTMIRARRSASSRRSRSSRARL